MGSGRGFHSNLLQSKGCKRPVEEAEAETGAEVEAEAEAKRACTDEANRDMEEFFALLDRIEATRGSKGPGNQKRTGTSEPVWRPAFVWEDFYNGNRTRDVESKTEEEHSKEEEEEEIPKNDESMKNSHDFLTPERSPPPDPNASNNEGCGIGSLDLNLPSTGMQLFF